MRLRGIVAGVLLLMCSSVAGQQITVHDEAGNPLPDLPLRLEVPGRGQSTLVTNSSGTITFSDEPLQPEEVLVVSAMYSGIVVQSDSLTGQGPWIVVMARDFGPVDDVVITARYGPESGERAVHRIRTISRKKIETMGAVNLRDVLRNELNIRLEQDNVLGSSVNVQGLNGQNVKILIDGVPMIGRQNGNIDISQINLNDIERIEIIEGPVAVTFGTDALAGVINLITRKPAEGKMVLSGNTYYETVGQYNADARVSVRQGNHGLSLSGGRNFFDSWSPADEFTLVPQATVADSTRAKPWDIKEQYFARFAYSFSRKNFQISPYVDHYYEQIRNRGMPRSPYGLSAFDDTYRTWRPNAGLHAEGRFDSRFRFNMVGAGNHYKRIKNTYVKDLLTLNEVLSVTPLDQDTSVFATWMSRGSIVYGPKDSRLSGQVGYDWKHETGKGVRIGDGRQEQFDIAAFASAEIKLWERLTIRPGLRWTYNSAYRAPLIPSLHTRYKLIAKAKGSTILRASWARGFRAPSLKELYFEFIDINHNIVGNTDLLAESSDNFQLAVDGKRLLGGHLWQGNISGYYNRVDNLISLAQMPGSTSFTYFNLGRFRSFGWQANLRWRRKNVDMEAGAAYIGRSNTLSEERLGVPGFSFSPEYRINARYEIPKIKIRVAGFYKFNGALPGFVNVDGEITETRIASYHQFDLSMSKDFWQQRITWMAGGKNLFDVQNINAGVAPGGVHSSGSTTRAVSWGRTMFTSIRFNFNHQP